jgi:hypothetical protein
MKTELVVVVYKMALARRFSTVCYGLGAHTKSASCTTLYISPRTGPHTTSHPLGHHTPHMLHTYVSSHIDQVNTARKRP